MKLVVANLFNKTSLRSAVLSALSVALFAGCTPTSTPPGDDGMVGPQSFRQDTGEGKQSDRTRKFAGKFTGKCSIQTGDRTLTGYTALITIKQSPRLLVKTRIFSTPSSRRRISNASPMLNIKFSDETTDELRINGHVLSNAKNFNGTINNVGFGFTRDDGSEFVFKFLALNRYEFWGTFQDDSNRPTFVKCLVLR